MKSMDALHPPFWDQACRELSAVDPVMAKLIRNYPGELLKSRGDPFYSLVRSIVGQQISVKAADSITNRLMLAVDPLTPSGINKSSEEALRAVGLSGSKARYMKDLATHFLDGRIDPHRFHNLDDEQIIQELIPVKGIGRWTAEMFLIFYMLRPDVLPVDDMGLLKAIKLHYGIYVQDYKLGKRNWDITDKWKPWRSVATWYCWRALDPVPVAY